MISAPFVVVVWLIELYIDFIFTKAQNIKPEKMNNLKLIAYACGTILVMILGLVVLGIMLFSPVWIALLK